MEESGSEGLDELLYAEKDKFLNDVDFVCISDNYWLGKSKPCITYGLRGICYFHIEIGCAAKDLHSGVFGGTVYVNFLFSQIFVFIILRKELNFFLASDEMNSIYFDC